MVEHASQNLALEPHQLLWRQLQNALVGTPSLEVRSHYSIQTKQRMQQRAELILPLAVLSTASHSHPTIHWVLDIDAVEPSDVSPLHHLAQRGVSEYWSLNTQRVELRTYQRPTAAGYQQRQIFQSGDVIHPSAFVNLTFQLQEPLPLYFLTRTATGQRTYVHTRLPLQLLRRRY